MNWERIAGNKIHKCELLEWTKMWNEIHSAGEKFYFEFEKGQATGLDVMWDETLRVILLCIILYFSLF